ncbi:MAG: hypothetical protein WBC83_02320 [Minisyncoccia bacterium]
MTGGVIYPTKKEILEELYVPTQEMFLAVRKWKHLFYNGKWATTSNVEKSERLYGLICAICDVVNTEHPQWISTTNDWGYDPVLKAVYVDSTNPSVLSALYELGRHILGESELQVSRFSVGVFAKCFPTRYEKLVWEDNMPVHE